jgi:ubiquinone/menaquinone biosynthesis C-methylase UbiE
VFLDASAYLGALSLTQRNRFGFGSDPIPQILNVEHSFGGRHLLEGAVHTGSLTATTRPMRVSGRRLRCTTRPAARRAEVLAERVHSTPMTQPPSPLATPEAWNLVAPGYVELIVPQFEPFANDALNLAGVAEGSRIVDVACGPGTLALLAAKRGARVSAIDFASSMVEALRARADRDGVTTIECEQGDGMALPYADGTFEAAFSMFGLMFFPDRARGFAELRRVLRPGGRAVVASWQPFDRVPLIAELFVALAELMPGLPFGKSKAPLGEPDEMRDEMREAGFESVAVHEIAYSTNSPSLEEWWSSMRRSLAPIVLLENKLGKAAIDELERNILARLERRFGNGPQVAIMRANAGLGTAPTD